MTEETKPKTFTITYTEQELKEKIMELESNESLNLFLKVEKGKEKYKEYIALLKVLESKEVK